MSYYATKTVEEGAVRKLLNQCRWCIEKTVHFEYLTISERAELVAPEGKFLTLTSNGVVRDIKPGFYPNATITVSDAYLMRPHGLMNVNQISRHFQTAICVENGQVSRDKCVDAAVYGGAVTDRKTDGVYISAECEGFNGILVAGDSEYEVADSRIELDGFGDNDFIGAGSAVAVVDRGRVDIHDCEFTMSGVTRCAIHVGGDSQVHVKNCDIINLSPASDWLGSFSWGVGLRGTNRLVQLSDNGSVVYENCRLKSNGWALCSLDGTDEHASLVIKDSTLELSGPRTHGYGAFCIGEAVEVVIDHSVVDVFGYPLLMLGMMGKARPSVVNGSVLKGRRFGVMGVGDDGSVLTIHDSAIDTDKSCIVLKGSNTRVDLKNSVLKAKNGVLLQMMDNDETSMRGVCFHVPVGEQDVYAEGRDLVSFDPLFDVELVMADMAASGDLFNSTTNLHASARAEQGGMGRFHDTLVGEVTFDGPMGDGGAPRDMNGPKNLLLRLNNARLNGVVSSAAQAYRDGVTDITADNCLELGNVTQSAAPTVNNGVMVELSEGSVWTVTGPCYITKLTLDAASSVTAEPGKTLSMKVDGAETPVAAGTYEGKIILTPRE